MCAGSLPDARNLVSRARQEAANFAYSYGYNCPVDHVARRLANLAQLATQEAAMRPLAVSATIIGFDEEYKAPQLHRVDPAGFYTGYYGVASGSKATEAMAALEKLQDPETKMFGESLEAVVKAGLSVMQKTLGQRIAADEVEIAYVDAKGEFTRLDLANVARLLEAMDRE